MYYVTLINVGQSNAGGYGMSYDTAPEHLRGGPIHRAYIFNAGETYWGAMEVGINTGLPNNPGAWSAVSQLAYEITEADPEAIVLVVNVVMGECGVYQDVLHQDWSPDSAGDLFDLTTETIARAHIAMFNAIGETMPAPAATVFIGMETDATDPVKAAAAAESLAGLAAAIRAEWMADPDGMILITRVSDSPALTYGREVNLAQAAVDSEDENMRSIDTAGMAMQGPDNPHYAAETHVAIGRSLFELGDGVAW